MDWQNLSKEECVKKLETNQSKGLSTSQVKKRLEQYGTNELTHKKKNGFFKKFISQFSDFMVIILLIAAAVSFITSLIRHDMDFIDSIIILTIVVVNGKVLISLNVFPSHPALVAKGFIVFPDKSF